MEKKNNEIYYCPNCTAKLNPYRIELYKNMWECKACNNIYHETDELFNGCNKDE